MIIHEFSTSLTIAAGSTSTVTLPIYGGLLQQFLVRANTDTTVFRANLVDSDGLRRLDYGFSTGELNQIGMKFPMVNKYTVNVTNASRVDVVRILLAVQE